MTSEAQELLKLIDGHMNMEINLGCDFQHLIGMKKIRWLVYNFFNAPKKEEVEDAGTKDFSL